jgi:hypothetical protein
MGIFSESGYIIVDCTKEEAIEGIKQSLKSKIPVFLKRREKENKITFTRGMGGALLNITFDFIPFKDKTKIDYVVAYSRLYLGYIIGMIVIISIIGLSFAPTLKDLIDTLICALLPIILIVLGACRLGLHVYTWRLKRRWRKYIEKVEGIIRGSYNNVIDSMGNISYDEIIRRLICDAAWKMTWFSGSDIKIYFNRHL